MKKISLYLLVGICIVTILISYKAWFTLGLISSGDLWPFSNNTYEGRSLPLRAWDQFLGNGLGGFTGPLLWIYLNFGIPITVLGKYIGLSWIWIERIAYLYPFLIISTVSSILLYKKIFPQSGFYLLSPLIFLFNTYILMIVGGGQIAGIGMAYALLPLVMYLFIRLLDEKIKFTHILFFSTGLSFQMMYDLRIAYVTICALGLYFFLSINRSDYKSQILKGLFSGFVVILLNFYWILPSMLVHQDPFTALGSQYSSIDAVRFFSFAKLENTLSLLHPNWPENVFGKTGFMKGEFLLIPILAYASILFLPKQYLSRRYVLFFALIGLIGAFLGKGVHNPMGEIYIFLFENFPGFILFRDPTKWITLVALSYSMVLPYSVEKIYKLLQDKTK